MNTAEWRRCDGLLDCPDGYDELNCHSIEEEEELQVVSEKEAGDGNNTNGNQ